MVMSASTEHLFVPLHELPQLEYFILIELWDLSPPPSLVGAYHLQHPDKRAIFLHGNLLCNGTCSVAGGAQRTGWGTNGKYPNCDYPATPFSAISVDPF